MFTTTPNHQEDLSMSMAFMVFPLNIICISNKYHKTQLHFVAEIPEIKAKLSESTNLTLILCYI